MQVVLLTRHTALHRSTTILTSCWTKSFKPCMNFTSCHASIAARTDALSLFLFFTSSLALAPSNQEEASLFPLRVSSCHVFLQTDFLFSADEFVARSPGLTFTSCCNASSLSSFIWANLGRGGRWLTSELLSAPCWLTGAPPPPKDVCLIGVGWRLKGVELYGRQLKAETPPTATQPPARWRKSRKQEVV